MHDASTMDTHPKVLFAIYAMDSAQVGTDRGRTLSFFYPRNDAILPWNIPFINNSSAKSTFPYLFSRRFAVFLRNLILVKLIE